MKKENQRGITLVESLTVIAIITILAAVSVPVISRIAPHYRLTGTGRDLVSALREAQSLAATKQYTHIIRFNSADRSYSLIRVVNGNEQNQKTTQLSQSVSFGIINLANNQISFASSGAPDNSGTVQLTNTRGENITIEITASGQIKSY